VTHYEYAKQKNVATAKAVPDDAGDAWTWVAIDADTKLVPSWRVGEEKIVVRKSSLSLKTVHALEVTRIAIGNQKLVYVLIANKKFSYPHGQKSAIAYIGTTKRGVARVAGSAAERAQPILSKHGVKRVTARIVTCRPRRNVQTWKKLERAMLLTFRCEYGAVPECNSTGKKMKETDEFKYFARDAVRNVIRKLG